MKTFKSKKVTAFTLAEVLITLGVIGVVSAMTIPAVIKNYQKKVTVERLKVVYSTISQAVKMSEIDNDSVATWEIPSDEASFTTAKTFINKYLISYFKNIKECNFIKNCTGEKIYYLNGNEFVEYPAPVYILNNGIVLRFVIQGGTNIQIVTDINGKKGPNALGKDIFSIVVNTGTNNDTIAKKQLAGSVHFFGQGNDVSTLKDNLNYGCNKNANGLFCGAWIMQNGWKIPDDYPW